MEKSSRIPEDSILGPLVFTNNIFIFFGKCELATYADNSTMCSSEKNKIFWPH